MRKPGARVIPIRNRMTIEELLLFERAVRIRDLPESDATGRHIYWPSLVAAEELAGNIYSPRGTTYWMWTRRFRDWWSE